MKIFTDEAFYNLIARVFEKSIKFAFSKKILTSNRDIEDKTLIVKENLYNDNIIEECNVRETLRTIENSLYWKLYDTFSIDKNKELCKELMIASLEEVLNIRLEEKK